MPKILMARHLTMDHVGLHCSTGVPRQVTWSHEGIRDGDTGRLLDVKLEWQITEVKHRPDQQIDLYLHCAEPVDHQITDMLITLDWHDSVWIEETPVEKLNTRVTRALGQRDLSHRPTRVEIWEFDDATFSWDLNEVYSTTSWPEVQT